MHVLFVHPNFPAQFGHIVRRLIDQQGWEVTFVTATKGPDVNGMRRVVYEAKGGATEKNHFCSRTFENTVWNCDGVYHALKARPEIKPDLIVGHSGFGSTLFLRELYGDTPIINLFEFYYHASGADCDMRFRADLGWPIADLQYHRARSRNAMILLDLQHCDAGYTPTKFQLSRFPAEYMPKLRTIFDGVERSVYHGHEERLRPPIGQRKIRHIGKTNISPTTRVVTYVSRGFESMRGFDIFMKTAKRIYEQFADVMFVVVGSERVCYGGDDTYIGGAKSFKEWVLARDAYDMSKFLFTGQIPPTELGRLLALTDLHIYLTVPFVLSWSMMNALSCGAVVLGSATKPVQEIITDGETGLLADFFDVEGLAGKAVEVLKDPSAFRALGRSAEALIEREYGLDAVLPRMLEFYDEVLGRFRGENA